jgi:hypothetical protein
MPRAPIVVGVLAVACGCAGSSRPSSSPAAPLGNQALPAEDAPVGEPSTGEASYDELYCPAYGMLVLYDPTVGTGSVFPNAHAIATAHYTAAQGAGTAGNHRAAALSYLDCARAYRAVPDADPDRTTAQENALSCYYNAMYSFAMANVFASEGRAALEREAKADPRLAPSIQKELASPPVDCHP